jgi:hypothetical protein
MRCVAGGVVGALGLALACGGKVVESSATDDRSSPAVDGSSRGVDVSSPGVDASSRAEASPDAPGDSEPLCGPAPELRCPGSAQCVTWLNTPSGCKERPPLRCIDKTTLDEVCGPACHDVDACETDLCSCTTCPPSTVPRGFCTFDPIYGTPTSLECECRLAGSR